MKTIRFLVQTIFAVLVAISFESAAQKISNVKPEINGNKVMIDYYINEGDSKVFNVSVFYADNKTNFRKLKSVTGDVGEVWGSRDRKRIVWDVYSDVEQLIGNHIVFKVRAEFQGTQLEEKEEMLVKSDKVIEFDDYIAVLQACEVSGEFLTVTFLITNKGDDRELSLFGKGTKIYNSKGNEYEPNATTLANTKSRGWQKVSKLRLVNGIPTKATIVFGKKAIKSKKIKLLEIKFDNNKYQLRDIEVTR
jgi:hypothetical protein